MSCDKGANPMRWDCATQGCFNLKKRPKIEVLADCLPGNMAFSDIDAIAEVCGNLLLLEWKSHPGLGTGQRILFERLTLLCPAVVLVVEGDAETMDVSSTSTIFRGGISPPQPTDLDGLREQIAAWSGWAMANSALRDMEAASCS